jgi:peptidoglycan biosynthesis protein MviN/MurJ (putative lipid II flippase)
MLWLDRFALGSVVPVSESVGIADGGATKALYLGAAGLALASALGAWTELALLQSRLRAHLASFRLPLGDLVKKIGTALLAAIPAAIVWRFLPALHIALSAVFVVGLFAAIDLALARAFDLSELDAWTGRFRKR